MARTPWIGVEGLDELRRDLIRLDKERFVAALKDAGQAVAEPVAAQVRAALPRRSGRLASTVRTSRIRSGAALRVGTSAVPYTGPVDFGGWPRSRPYVGAGRYIFPVARAVVPNRAQQEYEQALNAAIEKYRWEHP